MFRLKMQCCLTGAARLPRAQAGHRLPTRLKRLSIRVDSIDYHLSLHHRRMQVRSDPLAVSFQHGTCCSARCLSTRALRSHQRSCGHQRACANHHFRHVPCDRVAESYLVQASLPGPQTHCAPGLWPPRIGSNAVCALGLRPQLIRLFSASNRRGCFRANKEMQVPLCSVS